MQIYAINFNGNVILNAITSHCGWAGLNQNIIGTEVALNARQNAWRSGEHVKLSPSYC
jgi:hypothetical protein